MQRIPIDKKYFNVYYPIERTMGNRLAIYIQADLRGLYLSTTYSNYIHYLLFVTPNGRHLRMNERLIEDIK